MKIKLRDSRCAYNGFGAGSPLPEKESGQYQRLLAEYYEQIKNITSDSGCKDEAAGFVRIVPPKDGAKGFDVASAVVAVDARDCKGKFASGRTGELVDSDVVFRRRAAASRARRSRHVAVIEKSANRFFRRLRRTRDRFRRGRYPARLMASRAGDC